jgi:phenylacetate-coenzyme A ligase PaaK-like adenylate-forming protein
LFCFLSGQTRALIFLQNIVSRRLKNVLKKQIQNSKFYNKHHLKTKNNNTVKINYHLYRKVASPALSSLQLNQNKQTKRALGTEPKESQVSRNESGGECCDEDHGRGGN